MSGSAVIYDYLRTPFGRFGQSLAGVRPDDLAAAVVGGLLARIPEATPDRISDVILGDANAAGEDNRNVARMAALLAGLPTTVPGVTVNRLCGSGMEAVIQASRAVETGDGQLYVAGGVESMSRAPWVLPKPERAYPAAHATLHSSTLGWRMINPRMDPRWTVSLGETAEMLADRFSITREDQDRFAARSHARAAAAWESGFFDDQVLTLPGIDLTQDESIRPESTVDRLGTLKPAFRSEGGRVTAGNSSPLNDGAAALLIGAEGALDQRPLARICSRAVVGNDPDAFGIAPIDAANRALAIAGVSWDQVAALEINEAFAAQAIACVRGWDRLDPDRVNQHGGAIAIGHPLGASGARILGQLAHTLRESGGGFGVAAICIGVGQALAVVIEVEGR